MARTPKDHGTGGVAAAEMLSHRALDRRPSGKTGGLFLLAGKENRMSDKSEEAKRARFILHTHTEEINN